MASPLRHPGPAGAKADVSLEESKAGDAPLPMPDDLDRSAEGTGASGAASRGGTGSDTRGKSTGLETMLGKVFMDRGYITQDELEACKELQQARGEAENPAELAEVLIENEYLTRRQYQRVRSEVEAEKSTQQIPGYKIMKRLGSGAMATVFLAKQLSLDRLVAIKVLPTRFSTNEKFIERFYKEGRAAAQLNHRNIVAAYDVGQAGEHHYFVMEYVDGDTVYDRIVRYKRFKEKEAIGVIRQSAEALEHAHQKGFVHRDVKPKNIMITSNGVVKLADLGLARAVSDKEAAEQEAGRAYGTPYYISPEQIRGEMKIDGRADIYGLGATLYHMVTGRVPFEGKNPSAVMHKHLKQTLTPPDHVARSLSPETAMVIEMMMAKSRRKRYQSVTDLLVDLRALEADEKPHFAQVHDDLTRLSQIEDAVEAQVVESTPIVEPKKIGLPLDNPFFLATAGLAVLSLLINLVLIAVLTAGGDAAAGGTPTAGNTVGAPAAPAGASISGPKGRLIGAWTSTELSGGMFRNVDKTQLALYSTGDGSLVLWYADRNPVAMMFSWNASNELITFHFPAGVAEYRYSIDGARLTMDRQGDPGRMVLRKQ